MSDKGAPGTIGVLGHYGLGNLGDEAVIAAVLQSLRRHQPEAELICFSMNPADSLTRHGVTAYPIRRPHRQPEPQTTADANSGDADLVPPGLRSRTKQRLRKYTWLRIPWRIFSGLLPFLIGLWRETRFIIKSYRRLQPVDLLLITGSGQLFDYFGGPWGFPWTLLKWTLLARWQGTPVAILSVGAGPIVSSLSKRFLRRTLQLAAYRSYRDEYSRRLIETIGFAGPHTVAPDLAIGLHFPELVTSMKTADPLTVGLNAMPYCDPRYWPEHDTAVYEAYVDKLAAFISWLYEDGYQVRSFSTKKGNDDLVIEDIITRLSDRPREQLDCLQPQPIKTLAELLSVLSSFHVVVATRYHGAVLPLAMGIPTVGLSYHPKTSEIMSALGVSEFCFDVASFSVEELMAAFDRLVRDRMALISRLRRGHEQQCRELERQWQAVLSLNVS